MSSINDELEAMRRIVNAVEQTLSSYDRVRQYVRQIVEELDSDAQERVLRWVNDRYPQLHLQANSPQTEVEGPEAGQ